MVSYPEWLMQLRRDNKLEQIPTKMPGCGTRVAHPFHVLGRDNSPLIMTRQTMVNQRRKLFISLQKIVQSLHPTVVRHELKKLFIIKMFYQIQSILSVIEMYDCPVTPLPQCHVIQQSDYSVSSEPSCLQEQSVPCTVIRWAVYPWAPGI